MHACMQGLTWEQLGRKAYQAPPEAKPRQPIFAEGAAGGAPAVPPSPPAYEGTAPSSSTAMPGTGATSSPKSTAALQGTVRGNKDCSSCGGGGAERGYAPWTSTRKGPAALLPQQQLFKDF